MSDAKEPSSPPPEYWTAAEDGRRGLGTKMTLKNEGTELYWELTDYRHVAKVIIRGYVDGTLTCQLKRMRDK